MGALSHIRVLDLSRVLAGPWATQNLADLGADVIKVERPGVGDDTRSWGPPYQRDADGRDTAEAAYYLAANRNKRSLTLDISRPEGQAIVRALTAQSDVVVENYKVGQLAKYGLDYASLKAVKPDLVYCSVTGFGQNGPHASRAGYDFIIQGIGGFMSITGERDGLPGGGPQKAGVAIADLMTGIYASLAIMAALTHRDRTGVGQYIDMALLDTQVAMLANMNTNYLASEKAPVRWGNAHPNIVPYQTFQTGDDARFATNPSRVRHREVLVPMLAEMVRKFGKDAWIDKLEAAGVPCGPINTLPEVFAHPQVIAREMAIELPHPSGGVARLVASPMKMSETPPVARTAPPTLGQHSDDILRERLGFDEAKIAALRESGIV